MFYFILFYNHKKVYGKGSGKDCRLHVQKLNQMRIENENKTLETTDEIKEENLGNDEDSFIENENFDSQKNEIRTSKWSEFVETESNCEINSEPEDSRYTFERPNKRKARNKKQIQNYSNKKIKKLQNTNNEQQEYANENDEINPSIIKNQYQQKSFFNAEQSNLNTNTNNDHVVKVNQKLSNIKNQKTSKWDNFIDKSENLTDDEDSDRNPNDTLLISNNECTVFNSINKNVDMFLKTITQKSYSDKVNNFEDKMKSFQSKEDTSQEFDTSFNRESKWDCKTSQKMLNESSQKNDYKKNIFSTENDNLDDVLDF